MQPLDNEVKITINEECFYIHLSKIIKSYIRSPDKRELCVSELVRVIREGIEEY
jgi:hypothetical protein